MCKRKNEIDVKLLLFAIQKTVVFENLMSKTFTCSTLVQNTDHFSNNTVNTFYLHLI